MARYNTIGEGSRLVDKHLDRYELGKSRWRVREWATAQVEVHGYAKAKLLIKRLSAAASSSRTPAAWLVWASQQSGYPWMKEGDWASLAAPSPPVPSELLAKLAGAFNC